MFIQLIKQYDIPNKDQFRNSLMDLEQLKIYIQQATGYKNVNLLEGRDIESIEKEKQRLLTMLKNIKITIAEYIKQVEKL